MKTIDKLLPVILLSLMLGACGGGGGGGDDGDDGGDNGSSDSTRPTVSGAISQSNTTVLVSFSESMGDSAAVASNYSIVLENVNTEAGGLSISSATLSDDSTSVILQTASQGALTYRVTVVNAKDLAGNVMEQAQVGVGSDTSPASAVFAGTPPSQVAVSVASDEQGVIGWQDVNDNGIIDVGDGLSDAQLNTILLVDNDDDGVIDNWQDNDGNGVVSAGDVISGLLDSDLDGLQDSVEAQGWVVTITQADGSTTTRQVTSDPQNADTDGDNINDFVEFTNNADPRNSDTDGDSISDYNEWNVIFSNMTDKDSDNDGLPDLDEYQFYFTSPILADSDGDGISDPDELDSNRNPRIADRPKFSIDVKNVNLTLIEDFSYTDEFGSEQSISSETSTTLTRDESKSTTNTDGGVDEETGNVEAQLETGYDGTQGVNHVGTYPPLKAVATVGGGKSWTDTRSWETETASAQSASEAYEDSLTKGETLTNSSSYTRNITGASIALTVDVLNQGDFTLTFDDIQISVLKRQGRDLIPITTLSLPENFGSLQISPLNNDDLGRDVIFSNDNVPANVVQDLMKNVPGLVFKVVNYSVVDNEGISFASSDQDVFNRTAGIVFDYGDNDDAERFLVSVAGSNDVDDYVPGSWQGGIDGEGHARGISLDYAMQDILGMTRHYRYDTIEAGSNGVLDTALDETADDELDGDRILPGANGWIDTQPAGDDVLHTEMHDHEGNPTTIEQGIIAGADRRSASVALGDDIQEVPPFTNGLPYGTVVVSAGPDGILESAVAEGDRIEFIGGYETSRTCLGNDSTVGAICTLDADCNTDLETSGSCQGPERVARINTLRSGDFNRDWFVFMSEDIPTSANFNRVVIRPGQIYRLAFLQDLDRDGLTARTEKLHGSIDSSANRLDNRNFGRGFDFDAELAAGPGDDVFADSRDSDYDGLDDYAEIKIGWQVDVGGVLSRVYPHPGLRDSDNDGLEDTEEMDLRAYCVPDSDPADDVDDADWRQDALCSFLNDEVAAQQDAVAIIAGRNGIAESILGGDDIALKPEAASGLLFGQAIIIAGPNEQIDSLLGGDDLYITGSETIPATHPRLRDTDNDHVDDFAELTGYSTGEAIIDGGNGLAESSASGDDIALVINDSEMRPYGVIIAPGPNGVLDSSANEEVIANSNGDDSYFFTIPVCGTNQISDTVAQGDDVQLIPVGTTCSSYYGLPVNPGANGTYDSPVNQTTRDAIRPSVTVTSDPLREDSDSDNILDGNERLVGGNPSQPDSPDYRDTDNDGLTDYVEQNGWTITVTRSDGVERQYTVVSDADNPDSDSDGLPDLVEKNIGSSPVNIINVLSGDDTDGDGLSDYQEFNNFSAYAGYDSLFSGFELINDGNVHYTSYPNRYNSDTDGLNDYDEAITYGTDPLDYDTDNDLISDSDEVLTGWDVDLVNAAPYHVYSNPLVADEDGDGAIDLQEAILGTHPNNSNTDGDVYNVNDYVEGYQLGTNPLDPDDRCVLASFDSVRLDAGVVSYDDGGDVWSRAYANHLNQAFADQSAGNDIAYDVNSWFSVGQTKSFPSSVSTTVLMQANDKIHFHSEMAYRDYGAAAWSPTYHYNTYVTQNEHFNDINDTEVFNAQTYSSGSIRITTRSSAILMLDADQGNCR